MFLRDLPVLHGEISQNLGLGFWFLPSFAAVICWGKKK